MRTRVLVLDDQEYLREIISAVLNDAGFPARAVASTDEAIYLLQTLRPDLLVLDLALPKMSGLELLDRIRAEPAWATLPVIVVSGDPVKLTALEGRPHVVGLHKPFDVTVLVAEAARLLAPSASALSRSR